MRQELNHIADRFDPTVVERGRGRLSSTPCVDAAILTLRHWLRVGFAVIDGHRNLRYANAAAAALLDDGLHLRLSGSRVVGVHRNAERDFGRLLAAASEARGACPSIAQVSATSRSAVEVLAIAVESETGARHLALAFNEVRPPREGSVATLQSLFGLTAAEARLALLLAHGRTVRVATNHFSDWALLQTLRFSPRFDLVHTGASRNFQVWATVRDPRPCHAINVDLARAQAVCTATLYRNY